MEAVSAAQGFGHCHIAKALRKFFLANGLDLEMEHANVEGLNSEPS